MEELLRQMIAGQQAQLQTQQAQTQMMYEELKELRKARLEQERMPKLTPADDAEAYLGTFERMATRLDWPAEEWSDRLAPCLTGEAQRAYMDMSVAQSRSFPDLKKAILDRIGVTGPSKAQEFHDCS